MLEATGLTAIEEAIYRLLVSSVTAPADEIAAQTGLPIGQVEDSLAALDAKGLVRSTDRVPRQFAATSPDLALLPRLQREADALDRARIAVTDLLESYRDTVRQRDAGQLI
ncbi:helix-turn-helix domain-containing protein [Streptomyces sp. NPDC006207]